MTEKTKWIYDKNIGFSERNLNRWAIYGSRNTKIERILKRTDDTGKVIETCQIGAVGYKGKMWSLSSIHGRMMNIIEMLFYKQGMPTDNTVQVASSDLYNYLADAGTLFNESKKKGRNSGFFQTWVYDTLHVLTQITLMFSSWRNKDGSSGTRGLKLIKCFKMWKKDDVYLHNQDAEWGMVHITLDLEYADSLRTRNTTPLLIEVENSIKSDNAFAIYRYLRQVLFKTSIYKCNIVELHERLVIGSNRKDNLANDFKTASKELEGLEIPNGIIDKCEIIREGKNWVLVATRGSKQKTIHVKINQIHSESSDETDLLKYYESLDDDQKENINNRATELLPDNFQNSEFTKQMCKLAAIRTHKNGYKTSQV